MPASPVQFWLVQAGEPGPIIDFASGVLVREDLLLALSETFAPLYTALPTILERPQSCKSITQPYYLLRPHHAVTISGLSEDSGDFPMIAFVSEVPSTVVVQTAVRSVLAAVGIPGLAFSEPLFVA